MHHLWCKYNILLHTNGLSPQPKVLEVAATASSCSLTVGLVVIQWTLQMELQCVPDGLLGSVQHARV